MPPASRLRLPPALALCPRLRRPTARLSAAVARLQHELAVAFPDAPGLQRDPSLADRFDSTPYDHIAADVLAAADAFLRALDELDRPVALLDSDGSDPSPDGNGIGF